MNRPPVADGHSLETWPFSPHRRHLSLLGQSFARWSVPLQILHAPPLMYMPWEFFGHCLARWPVSLHRKHTAKAKLLLGALQSLAAWSALPQL